MLRGAACGVGSDGDHEDTDKLSDLRAGDRVAVWQSARKTVVLAKIKRDDDGF